jgi:hypothetical protein
MVAATAAADPPRPDVVERSRVQVEPAGRAFKQLTVDNPLGDVRVEGYDGIAIVIETRKHAPSEDALERLRVSLVPNPDGTVRISTTADAKRESLPIPRGSVRIDLLIHAPRDARVDAAAISGKLEVVNMDAGGELDTASGAITVHNMSGALSTHSVSGATSLSTVFGSVDAQTMSSDVDLDTINGDRLIASAHHGKIQGRRVRARDVELTTTDGKIMLEGETSLRSHVVVSSLRGDIEVRLRRSGPVIVRARAQKLNLGAPPTPKSDGWSELKVGNTNQEPALVEMSAVYARVDFSFLQ